jgi:GT2 family glycosyltransferase
VGFARALDGGADYCLRLDSDTVMDSDFLRQLVTSMQSDPTLGAVMGKILYYDDPERIWSLGGERVGHFFFNHNVGQDEMDGPAFAQAQTIDYIWSTGMLISRAALEATGGFDPDFTVYYEEMDLSERLRAAGFRLQAVPQARMWHKVGELAHGEWVAFNWARGKMLFFRKHSRGWQRLALVVYAYAYALLRAVKPKAGAGNRGPLRAALSGLTAGLRVPLRSS